MVTLSSDKDQIKQFAFIFAFDQFQQTHSHIADNLISGNRWGGIDIRHTGDPRVTCNLICNGLSDGIVVGSKGLGTIEANVIRGH